MCDEIIAGNNDKHTVQKSEKAHCHEYMGDPKMLKILFS